MKILPLGAAAMAALIAGCAASPELVSCMQPNRRVAVEVTGTKERPPNKKTGKKQRPQSVLLKGMAQGDSAWDPGSAVLKDGGKKDLDRLVNTVQKGTKRDKRPTTPSAIVISGHTDKMEAGSNPALDEQRAKAVQVYLVSKGLDQKTMFWEGKDAKEPMAVTKFCDE